MLSLTYPWDVRDAEPNCVEAVREKLGVFAECFRSWMQHVEERESDCVKKVLRKRIDRSLESWGDELNEKEMEEESSLLEEELRNDLERAKHDLKSYYAKATSPLSDVDAIKIIAQMAAYAHNCVDKSGNYLYGGILVEMGLPDCLNVIMNDLLLTKDHALVLVLQGCPYPVASYPEREKNRMEECQSSRFR